VAPELLPRRAALFALLGPVLWVATLTAPSDPSDVALPPLQPWHATAARSSAPSIEQPAPGVALGILTSSGSTEITGVLPHSAAARAGILVGDVVTRIDGEDVSDSAALRRALAYREPGERIAIEIARGGQPRVLHATLTASR
jgi:S1-C subfamily serine protease